MTYGDTRGVDGKDLNPAFARAMRELMRDDEGTKMSEQEKPVKKANDRYQDVRVVGLGGPIILGGKNFPERLDADKYPGLEMAYDRLERMCIIRWNGETAEVPHFVYKMPGVSKWKNRTVQTDAPIVAPVPQGKIQAQVGGPQHHVFAGPGAGMK